MVYAGKMWRAAVLVLGLGLLTGCDMMQEDDWTPREEAAISIDEEGRITEYLSEKLDQAYYNFDELKSMLDSEVADYNARHGDGSVTVVTAEQEEGKANLVIEYRSGADYAEFNNIEFYYGSMINAQLSGYLFDVSYKQVNDGVVQVEEVSGSEVLKKMADQVVVVRAPLEVHVPGNIDFMSSNANALGSNVVLAVGTGNEDSAKSVVTASEEEREAMNRVYIVFEEK